MGHYYLFASGGPVLDIEPFSLGYHASIKPRTVYEHMDKMSLHRRLLFMVLHKYNGYGINVILVHFFHQTRE